MKLSFNAVPGYFEEAGSEGGGGGGGDAWNASLSDEIRGDDSLKSVDSLENLAKGYISSQRMLGTRIPIPGEEADEATRAEFNTKLANVPGVFMLPGEDADEEALGAFYTKLGRPATPEEYGIKLENLPEGVTVNEEAMGPMLKFFHELGLSTAQARKAVEYRMTEAGNEAKAMKTVSEAAAANLKGEWGAAYEQNMGIGKTAAGDFGEDDAAVLENLAQSSPAVARALHKLGTLTLEDNVLRQFGQGGEPLRTPAEIEAELVAIEGNPGYANGQDPQHAALMAKASKLQQELAKAKAA